MESAEVMKRLAVFNDPSVPESAGEAENLRQAILTSGVLSVRAVRNAAHIA